MTDCEYAVKQFKKLSMGTSWYITLSVGTHEVKFTSPTEVSFGGELHDCILEYVPQTGYMHIELSDKHGYLKFVGDFRPRDAKFVGRDRTTKSGYGHMIPDNYAAELLELSRPKKYVKKGSAPIPNVDVQYMEEPGPDYPVPDYNIVTSIPGTAKLEGTTAICIIGCDRPDYMKQVVQALALNPEAKKWPVYAFIDKPIDSSDWHKVDEQVMEIKRHFEHPHIIRRPVNYGCGRNIIDARIQLFENVKHSKVYVFEDDLVPNPEYITLCENIWKWVEDSGIENVGAVQGWEWCQKSEECRAKHTNYIRATVSNWWGYSMTKKCWDEIAPTIHEYHQKFLYGKYSNRPHKTILKWIQEKLKPVDESSTDYSAESQYAPQHDYAAWNRRYFSGPPTGQDAITMLACYITGNLRLAPVVNRGAYIGQEGIHMSPAAWRQHGYHLIKTIQYPEDRERVDFEPQIHDIVDEGVDNSKMLNGMKHVAY